MKAMTAANLRSAFGGESMAHMRYLVWADKADHEGLANVARLFRAVAFAEQAHASGHFAALKSARGDFVVTAGGGFGLGTTAENLAGAIAGENFEVEQMYPAYIEVARMQGEKAAAGSMEFAIAAEQIHAGLFTRPRRPSTPAPTWGWAWSRSASTATTPWRATRPTAARSAAPSARPSTPLRERIGPELQQNKGPALGASPLFLALGADASIRPGR